MSANVKKYGKWYLIAGVAFAAWEAYKSTAAREPMAIAENAILWPVKLAKSF